MASVFELARMHIFHVDPEMGFSGGEVQVFLLIDGLVERGHTCTVVAQPGSAVEKAARERYLPTVSLPMRADWDVFAVRKLTKILAKTWPDVVHLHTGRANWLGGWAAHRVGLPVVSTRRMDRRVKRNWKNGRIYGSFVTQTAAISPAVLKQLHEGGVLPHSTQLIWSVVDPARLKPTRMRAEVRRDLEVQDDRALVLAAGALVPRKGYDSLLRSISKLQERPVLCIAGGGPDRVALQALAAELGVEDCVRFLGRRSDIPNLLAAADLFAMPSHAEGLGIAALEAMAVGLPLLASAVGGLKDLVVDGETGLLLPHGDVDAWATALERTLADPEARKSMGQAGRRRVQESFLPVQMVDGYEKLYRKALERRE